MKPDTNPLATAATGLLCLAALGCGSDRSTMEIRARAALTEAEGLAGLVLTIGDTEFTADDFEASDNGLPVLATEVPNEGTLRITVRLDRNGTFIAEGSFDFQLRTDFVWGMDVFRRVDDPAATCFGCIGSRAFPIADAEAGADGESVWLVWGGVPRGSNIVF